MCSSSPWGDLNWCAIISKCKRMRGGVEVPSSKTERVKRITEGNGTPTLLSREELNRSLITQQKKGEERYEKIGLRR